MLTYPIEYGNVLTPQPDTIYDKNPPMAVRLMNIEDVPIASINEKPKSAVKITIRNTPPPMPKRPDANPTKIPMTAQEIRLNGIFASSLSLFKSTIFLIATNNSKHPNIISKVRDGSPEATKPPTAPPTIPNIPNCKPGFTIPSKDFVCLYAPLNAVGIIMARLVPIDMSIARLGSTPMYFNRKYCKGTIKNPPPTPKSPDAKPAQIPIKIKPMKYSIGNIIIIYLNY